MSEAISDAEELSGSFKVTVSVLIALTALTGALLSWRAVRIAESAGVQDSRAIQAALHEANTEIAIASNATQQRDAFRAYQLHLLLSRLIKKQVLGDPRAPGTMFDDWQREITKAQAWRDQVDQDYLERDGDEERFEEDRYCEAFRAEAAGQNALDAAPFVRRAELERGRVRAIVTLNIILAAALFLFTLSLKTEGRGRIRWAAIGLALFCSALGLGLWQALR